MKLKAGAGSTSSDTDTVTVDVNERMNPDVLADVNNLPFRTETFDEVHAYQVLEHLSEPLRALKELERVLKTDQFLKVKVPHARSVGHLSDPTHRSNFTTETWKYIDTDYQPPGFPSDKPVYRNFNLVVEQVQFYSLDTAYLPQKVTNGFCRLFSILPWVYEYFYWLFPIDTRLVVRLRKTGS